MTATDSLWLPAAGEPAHAEEDQLTARRFPARVFIVPGLAAFGYLLGLSAIRFREYEEPDHGSTVTEYLADCSENNESRTPEELKMTEFKGVTVVKKANVYFDGKVTSRTVQFTDGSKKTLGIMLPGEYTFNTDAPELMEILSGDLQVLLPGDKDWRNIRGGQQFEVPAKSSFSLKIKTLTDYCCSFLP